MTLYKLKGNSLSELSRLPMKAKGYQEEDLETWIELNPQVLSDGEEFAIIGRQYPAGFGMGDLLALDSDGNLVVVELKGKRTPRDTLAQALEYMAYVAGLSLDEVISIYEAYRLKSAGQQDFSDVVKSLLDLDERPTKEDVKNQGIASEGKHRVMIVAEEITDRVRSVAEFLGDRDVDIECRTVTFYEKDDEEYIEVNCIYRSQKSVKERGRSISRLRTETTAVIRPVFDKLREGLLTLDVLAERPKKTCVAYKIRVGNRLLALVSLFPLPDLSKSELYVYFYKYALEEMGLYEDFCDIITSNTGRTADELMTKGGDFHIGASEADIGGLVKSVTDALEQFVRAP